MKINLLRKIDYYIGPVVCRFLLFCRWLTSTMRIKEFQLNDCYKNILVVKFFGMGTILLASPALRQLKEKYKSSKITILTVTSNRELCEMLPSIDSVMCLNIDTPISFLHSFIKFLLDIRKRNFEIVIDLEFLTNFSALVVLLTTLLSRPKITVGFNSPLRWRNRIHNINVSFDHSRHITKIIQKVIHSLGVEQYEYSFDSERNSLFEKMDTDYGRRLFKSNDSLAHCNYFICLNINAGALSLHRRWPREHFAIVVNELIKKPDIAILLIGGESEIEYVSEFKRSLSLSPRIVDLCGKTDSIRELIGLFKNCDLLITNDSGPFHLAHIIGLPTISFFGPETPNLYGPINGKHHVFYGDLYCSPCLNIYNSKTSYCKRNVCLLSIKPDRVLQVIENDYLPLKSGTSKN